MNFFFQNKKTAKIKCLVGSSLLCFSGYPRSYKIGRDWSGEMMEFAGSYDQFVYKLDARLEESH